jgi:diguanylate cyclase (GGDEF)-like protein
MAILTQKQIQLLARVLSGSGLHSASENALGFRASNEEALDDLDELERQGVLIRKDNKYSLSLVALADLRSRSPEADRIFHLCDHVFNVVRRLYKGSAGQWIPIDKLVEAADVPENQVQRALNYLSQVSTLWSGLLLGLLGALSQKPAVQPAEGFLRYKTFDEVIEELRVSRKRIVKPFGNREKQQKFGVLDSPALLKSDLAKQCGILGRAVLYLDLDNFKEINTRLTEVVVDRLILPPTHEVLASCAGGLGSAYAEGGDEFTMLLPNSSEAMALDFARAVHAQISGLRFKDSAGQISLSVSIGVAHGLPGEDGEVLRERANLAKNHAKANGKNCISLWGETQCRTV